jgi:pimeloyl-ACP methyl ester carboxylesterase
MIAEAEPRAVAALLRTIANRPDLLPMLAELRLPVLIVGGRDDRISPPERVTELAAALEQATLRLVPGAGHMAPIEAPQAMTAILGEFLAQIRAPGRP